MHLSVRLVPVRAAGSARAAGEVIRSGSTSGGSAGSSLRKARQVGEEDQLTFGLRSAWPQMARSLARLGWEMSSQEIDSSAPSSSCAYSLFGVVSKVEVGPSSTARPSFMMSVQPPKNRTVGRLWEIYR